MPTRGPRSATSSRSTPSDSSEDGGCLTTCEQVIEPSEDHTGGGGIDQPIERTDDYLTEAGVAL